MILLSIFIFMYLILKGTVADQNDTSTKSSGIQLWRVQGDLDEEVIDEFYERGALTVDSFTWLAYPYLDDINRYLVKVGSSYKYATVTSIGWTFKKNPITMLRISNEDPKNAAVLVDSGMHGNERTAILSNLYFIESIVKNFPDQPEYIQNKDWYFIPVLNPDGYEYSFDFDPVWRKNRRKFNDKCVGVDLGRNFDYDWKLTAICDSFFSGPVPFSEEETIAFKNLADRVHFYAYVSIHSSGFSFPQTKGKSRTDDKKIIRVPKEIAKALSNYKHGHIERELEVSAGSSMEWMTHEKRVNLSYLLETRGVDADDKEKRKEIEVVAKEVRARILKLAETHIIIKNTDT